MENTIEIDYLFCGFTDCVGYIIKNWSLNGTLNIYRSPIIFDSIDDAYIESCIHLSNK